MSRDWIIDFKQMELLIPGYPKGSDITVINTTYIPRCKVGTCFEQDYISILFRDNKTGAKMVHTIYEPLYTFYYIKKEYQKNYNQFFIDKDKVIPVTCMYADILRAIAQVTGRMKEYDNIIKQENGKSELRKLHADPRIMFSDMHIENYYRFLFNKSYKNNTFKLRKGFMDIEVDIAYSNFDFPESGAVPINAYAYLDDAGKTVYQFLYNDKNNPNVEKYKRLIEKEDVVGELKKFVINAVGGIKKAKKYGVDNLDYKIVFFDDEMELIKTMFKVAHATCPDFIEFWNMAFDLNYITNRIMMLDEDPLDIICDDRIDQQYFKFYVDEKNINKYEERGDFVAASSYTVYLDQMIEFASRRKGRGAFQSFKLDAIGEVIAGVRKLDYSHITSNLGNLPYIDMKTFSFYNVMDVIVQKCIEVCTEDLEYVFTKCLINNTNYAKCHRQSIYLANRFTKEFDSYGYIIGNNKNKWNEKPTAKFPGAMVGDPTHNSPMVMIKVNGKHVMLFDNTIDFDYSSLYPNIILENNIAPNTQVGKVIIMDPDDPLKPYSLCEHHDMYSSDDVTANYSRGGEFLENLMCNNPMEFGRRWMGLGDVYEVIEDITEFEKFNGTFGRPIDLGENEAIYFTRPNSCTEALIFNSGLTPAITFHNHLDNDYKEKLETVIRENAVL